MSNPQDLLEALQDPDFLKRYLEDPLLILPDEEKHLLRRCALPRTFDRRLYAEVLTKDVDVALSFDELVKHQFIETLPGIGNHVQVKDTFRQNLFNSWWASGTPDMDELPERLQQVSNLLAHYFEEQNNPTEKLYHLILADGQVAEDFLHKYFDEAERQYNLSQCHEILRVLDERENFLGERLIRAKAALNSRYRARAQWANEYFETRVYLERNQTRGLFDQLLLGDPFWILQLYANGGMGKTMYLRAVIANECVQRSIPVARIDFDHVLRIGEAMSQPWRLLLSIAQQLDQQLDRHPFRELLRDHANDIIQTDFFSGWKEPLDNEVSRTSNQQDIVDRFSSALFDIVSDQQLVLIFDTLENLRHRQIALKALFNLLLEVKAELPNLRLIFSGRFDLAEETGAEANDYATLFYGQERTLQLGAI